MRTGGSRPFHRRSYLSCPLWRQFPTACLRPSPENTPQVSRIVQLRGQPDGSLLVSMRSDADWTPISRITAQVPP